MRNMKKTKTERVSAVLNPKASRGERKPDGSRARRKITPELRAESTMQ